MSSKFRHVALIGKYQAQGSRSALEDIARFLIEQGCEIALEKDTAQNTGITAHTILMLRKLASNATSDWWSVATAPCWA